MTTALTNRLVRTVLIAGLALPVMTLLSPVETVTTAKAATTTMAGPQSEAATLAEFNTILAQYGTFTVHQKYGEVWVPTVTPQGWHPYPACQWVYTKDVGWYFNDDTAWGSIVHHYGRWSHDEQIGWIPLPGRPTANQRRPAGADPANEHGQSAVGSTARSWRAAQARL
jgi:hypothetical protein